MTPFVCFYVWTHLLFHFFIDQDADPVHLLWALYFLKQYPTERAMAGIVNADAKTIDKYKWKMIEALENLYYVLVSLMDVVDATLVVVVLTSSSSLSRLRRLN